MRAAAVGFAYKKVRGEFAKAGVTGANTGYTAVSDAAEVV
jgi:hypothetical protein